MAEQKPTWPGWVFLLLLVGGLVAYWLDPPAQPGRDDVADVRSEVPSEMTATPASSNDAGEAAGLLLGGDRQAKQIERIAKRYSATATSIADMAAKSAELCGQPGSQSFAFGSLTFVDVLNPKNKLELAEAFVLYVTSGCPLDTGSK